ncbi:hypothetical protein SmJEL517_g05002 [Synchytrium microbalum]|uniref:VPS9 domain-containing protein n=1 Tax=Synchytrium microbalum TaxID=1806994 RepID=A0A507BXB3_9FUNG|nr:uncharacterized protein SmJEL517_g05002 [Synchytrium microbalum]TPX31731.1 hypothetical protein SmJEL517_g05002 [Synchytrium microbalum]
MADPLEVIIQNNLLFNAICKKFPHYISNIHVNDWTLCLPATSIQANSISEEFVATHVLRPTYNEDEYTTVNNKQVYLQDGTIRTGQGFPVERISHVLADILYRDDIVKPINVYLVDVPFIKPDVEEIDYHLAESAATLPILLREIRSDVELNEIDGAIAQFNDQVITLTELDALLAEIKKLLGFCFERIACLHERIEPLLHRLNLSVDTLYQVTETYVMENTYEVCYFILQRAHRNEDADMADALSRIQHLDINQMGLRFNYGKNVVAAVTEFKSISLLRTPFEKIKKLMRSIYALTGSDPTMTSDQLIPLMIFMLIRSNQVNLLSTLYYMKTFIFEHDIISGELGYGLSTLEAVISYITNNKDSLADLSIKNLAFWGAVISGDVEEVGRMLDLAGYSIVSQQSLQSPPSPSKSSFPFQEDTLMWVSVVNSRDFDGNNALLLAAQNRQLPVVSTLCQSYVAWRTYLEDAAINLNVRRISSEYQHPGNPDTYNYTLNTSLHLAVILNDFAQVDLLLAQDASIDKSNENGETPLIIACRLQNIEMIDKLIQAGADVNAATSNGTTCLHLANLEMVRLLLYLPHINPNIKNLEGLTPLLYHCQHGRQPIVSVLVKNPKVDINSKDLGHRTTLHLCCFRGYSVLVEQILSRGEEVLVDETSLKGNTGLHAAADAEHIEIVLMLLQFGADPTVRNLQGKTAADLAKNEDIRELLDDYSLFRSGEHKQQERVASVARAIPLLHDKIVLVVKSGLYPDISSITTVHRELQDFALLRQQLLVERPEACLPELKDLVNHPAFGVGVKPGEGLSQRQLRRLVRRLHRFLNFLLQHPVFRHSELVWEFCVVTDIEVDMILSRTKLKVEHEQEQVADTVSPVIRDLENDTIWRNADTTLSMLNIDVKQTGLAAKRLGKARKDMSNQIRTLRWHVGRPSSLILESSIKSSMVDLMRKVTDVMGKQSLEDVWDIGEPIYESHHDFGLNVLKKHEDRVHTYTDAAAKVAAHVTTISRLEAVPKALGSMIPSIFTGFSDDGRAKRLSEMYFQLESLQQAADKTASLLNHGDSQLIQELSFFHKKRADDIIRNLQNYASRQLAGERTVKDAVTDAIRSLDGYSATKAQQASRVSIVGANTDDLIIRQEEPSERIEEMEESFNGSGANTPFTDE